MREILKRGVMGGKTGEREKFREMLSNIMIVGLWISFFSVYLCRLATSSFWNSKGLCVQGWLCASEI